MAAELPRWEPAPDAVCARCNENPAGTGGIICTDCRAAIEARNRGLAEPGPEASP